MTAQEFIDGLRERGYRPLRFRDGAQVILPRIDGDDKLFRWLQDTMGVEMRPYRNSREVPLTYEASLHRALVDLPAGTPAEEWISTRSRLIWEAAAPC